MSKRWVLDTETKGTGAQVVPLETRDAGAEASAPIVVRERQPVPAKEPAPREPPRFKVVDVMTRQVIAEGTGTRETVQALEQIRSVVDVNVYIWQEAHGAWLQLTQVDRARLWDLRGRQRRSPGA